MHGRRFGPEVYVRKAEDDIGRTQLRRSLEEPAWDGFCGLVLLNEDAAWTWDSLGTDRGNVSSRGAPGPTDEPSQSQAASSAQSIGGVSALPGSQQQVTLHGIRQEIKDIASTPPAQRNARLESLARRALEASQPPCDTAVAHKLLKLAELACQSLKPAPQALAAQIQASLTALATPDRRPATDVPSTPLREGSGAAPRGTDPTPQSQVATEDREGTGVGLDVSSGVLPGRDGRSDKPGGASAARQKPLEAGDTAAASTRRSAAAANELYLAAVACLKRGEIKRASSKLREALEACPPEKGAARKQIQRHLDAVTAEIRRVQPSL